MDRTAEAPLAREPPAPDRPRPRLPALLLVVIVLAVAVVVTRGSGSGSAPVPKVPGAPAGAREAATRILDACVAHHFDAGRALFDSECRKSLPPTISGLVALNGDARLADVEQRDGTPLRFRYESTADSDVGTASLEFRIGPGSSRGRRSYFAR